MALHEIIRRYPGDPIGRMAFGDPEAGDAGTVVGLRGQALMFDSDQDTAALATGVFAGFLTRNVQVAGPVLGDLVFPGRLDLPFMAGEVVSVEKADAYEAEGDDYVVTSGTGALTSGTAIGSLLSFVNGKTRVKQSSDVAYFTLAAILDEEVEGNLRIRAEAIR